MNVDSNGWWFALALVNAGLAEQKNRSRLAWFLLSSLLGPFATAWIVIAPAPLEQSRVAPEQWPTVLLFTTAGLLTAAALILGAVAATSASPGLWFACVVAAAGAVLVFVTAWKKATAPERGRRYGRH